MPIPKRKNKKKRKGKIKISKRTGLVRKTDEPQNGMRKIKSRTPPDVAPTFKIKIRKK